MECQGNKEGYQGRKKGQKEASKQGRMDGGTPPQPNPLPDDHILSLVISLSRYLSPTYPSISPPRREKGRKGGKEGRKVVKQGRGGYQGRNGRVLRKEGKKEGYQGRKEGKKDAPPP